MECGYAGLGDDEEEDSIEERTRDVKGGYFAKRYNNNNNRSGNGHGDDERERKEYWEGRSARGVHLGRREERHFEKENNDRLYAETVALNGPIVRGSHGSGNIMAGNIEDNNNNNSNPRDLSRVPSSSVGSMGRISHMRSPSAQSIWLIPPSNKLEFALARAWQKNQRVQFKTVCLARGNGCHILQSFLTSNSIRCRNALSYIPQR